MSIKISCGLEEKFLNEFLLILNSKDIKGEDTKKQFNLARIYSHILNCDEHKEELKRYLNNLENTNEITPFTNKNILYLTQYLYGNGTSKTN